MSVTIYIHPALTDQAGRCRIYVKGAKVPNARDDCRANPSDWHECGLMNSRGEVVAFIGPRQVYEEIKSCEPLMAGTTFHFEGPDKPYEKHEPALQG